MPDPERGFRREANAKQADFSTIQKVVRYTENNDILLYVTALFGIVMPGLIYFFYKTVHTKYHAYNQKVFFNFLEQIYQKTNYNC